MQLCVSVDTAAVTLSVRDSTAAIRVIVEQQRGSVASKLDVAAVETHVAHLDTLLQSLVQQQKQAQGSNVGAMQVQELMRALQVCTLP